MALVVADQIVQGEPIVGGDEIDAGVRAAAIVLVQIGGAGQAIGQLADQSALAAPVVAHHVAILAVPFAPADRKLADLIAVFAHVPWLGNQLDL